MRIAQIVLPAVSGYESKCQRLDREGLVARGHEIVVVSPAEAARSGARLAHVYAGGPLPREEFVGFPLPYVAPFTPRAARWPHRRAAPPARLVSPLHDRAETGIETYLPEAVDDAWFDMPERRAEERSPRRVGSVARPGVRNAVEQSLARIHRFREDVVWILCSAPPSPADLAEFDVWVDPAADDGDLDGCTAEALVAGLPVVATRTRGNATRLEMGRCGLLVPPRDPNELTHAILAALFKPEVTHERLVAARQTRSKFRPRQRLRVLERIYESLTP